MNNNLSKMPYKASTIFFALFLCLIFLIGCNAHGTPWSKGYQWPADPFAIKSERNSVNKVYKRKIKSYCERKENNPLSYEKYLNKNYKWPSWYSKQTINNRKEHIRLLIKEYKQKCE